MLSFLPDSDQDWPFPPEILTDRGAFALGRLARELRTALACYDCPPDAVWQAASGGPAGGQAIQHGDLGPWNLLWDSDGEICGVLDWDLAGPGDPWYDTGHLAWFTVPFQDDVRARERGFAEPPDRHARLEAFAVGAETDINDLVAIVQQTQQESAHRVLERGRTLSDGPWRTLLDLGIHEKALSDRLWTRDHFGS